MTAPVHIVPGHGLAVALLHPQIAPNTGNIARTCVATGCALHLVRPMGFVLSDKQLRRSAMDYWQRLDLTVHDDQSAFFTSMGSHRMWYFDSGGARSIWSVEFEPGDVLVFGSETRGLDPSLLSAHSSQTLHIPQLAGERCLNLSTAVGVATYEALRRIQC